MNQLPFHDIASIIHVTNANMILLTKAGGSKTYHMGDGDGVSALTNVTYNTIRAQNPEYAIHFQSCYGQDESHCKINGNNALPKGIVFETLWDTPNKRCPFAISSLNCIANDVCDVKIRFLLSGLVKELVGYFLPTPRSL